MLCKLNENEKKDRLVLSSNEKGGSLKSPKKGVQEKEPWEDGERDAGEGNYKSKERLRMEYL